MLQPLGSQTLYWESFTSQSAAGGADLKALSTVIHALALQRVRAITYIKMKYFKNYSIFCISTTAYEITNTATSFINELVKLKEAENSGDAHPF